MAKKRQEQQTAYDNRVKLYPDGKYHWIHEVSLFKNPAILFDVYKVFGITLAICFFLFLFIFLLADGFSWEAVVTPLKIIGVMALIFLVLVPLGYLLYAAMSGGKYGAHFIMDETGIVHQQAPQSQKVAKRIGFLTALAGIAGKRPGVVGTGIMASSRTSMRSSFDSVKSVKAIKWLNMIKVNETLEHNRVYVNGEDFDFVYNFISSHCPKAKK
ncbi:MAG: hypothetical protein K5683_02370 [Prevotella sp.]|nr:hypothetical protein [Prevotella sp.]